MKDRWRRLPPLGKVVRVFKRLHSFRKSLVSRPGTGPVTPSPSRQHNVFEAAASYVSGCAEDDQEQMDAAMTWVSPEALSFGINELACRAVIALARERDESPQEVARNLLGLPTG
ncbi:hypothetical protein ACIBCM_31325 [Streptomyces sp. NPDC051018]|uniref:hypothetical protein n=1 Tax=Streptomyces sp. NPDC051018 TaxID=3365639 RepID=UPI003798FCA8